MYYLVETKVISKLWETYKAKNIYWSFSNIHQFNIALANKTMCYKVLKKDIPGGAEIKDFSHFKDIGYKSSFLRMIAK